MGCGDTGPNDSAAVGARRRRRCAHLKNINFASFPFRYHKLVPFAKILISIW